ncbi:hypothetical protein J1605_023159 [Eschrichtius robustus]|uniref:Uncharacterized protein n=1 Tax=Eschrichtius robustus TaxID=9764 RepID=A0AB34H2X3_ESCRO|nr:hypothetical protein J1605_023159 [Eschrichtius robustus]
MPHPHLTQKTIVTQDTFLQPCGSTSTAWRHAVYLALVQENAVVGKALSAPSFPQKPSCKATKLSQLGLSAALLVFLGTLVPGTLERETSKQAQGKSRLTSPLQAGAGGEGMRRVHGRGWGAGVGWVLTALSGFLLGSWAVVNPGTFHDSQKESLCFSF